MTDPSEESTARFELEQREELHYSPLKAPALPTYVPGTPPIGSTIHTPTVPTHLHIYVSTSLPTTVLSIVPYTGHAITVFCTFTRNTIQAPPYNTLIWKRHAKT